MKSNRFFYKLIGISIIYVTSYSFMIPVLPDLLSIKGLSLSLIGFILSFYQIAYFCFSIFLGRRLVFYSKPKTLLFGEILLICSMFSFVILSYPLSEPLIVFLSILLRICQGISYSLISIVTWSYFPSLFPESLDQTYTIAEIYRAIGMSLGPILGGFFNEGFGYSRCCMAISFIYLITTIIFYSTIREEQDIWDQEKLIASPFLDRPMVSYSFLKKKNFLLTFFIFFISFICYGIIQPGFSQNIHTFGVSDGVIGLVLGLGDLTYAASGVVFAYWIFKQDIKRKKMFIIGGALSGLSLLFIGPEKFILLPQSLFTICIGMIILGISQQFYLPILIPEFLEILKENENEAKGKIEMATAIFNAGVASTQTLSMILGGIFSDYFGFSRGMTVYSLVVFGYIVFYAIYRK